MRVFFCNAGCEGEEDIRGQLKSLLQVTGMLKALGDEVVSQDILKSNPLGANESLWYLGALLKDMSLADAAYFIDGWEKTRDGRIMHEAAKAYGMKISYVDRKKLEELFAK